MTDDGAPTAASHDCPDDPMQVTRSWPAGRALADDECIELSCVACRTHWRIHDRLRGFRLRCDCGQWVEVPAPDEAPVQIASAPDPREKRAANLPARIAKRQPPGTLVEIPGEPGEVIYATIPVDAPIAPGTLQRASATNQARWTNRTVAEFIFLMSALLGPQVVAWLLSSGKEFELLLPFTSFVSALLVALVIAWAGPFGRIGLRAATGRYFVEAVLVAAAFVALAVGYLHVLETWVFTGHDFWANPISERLGLPASLFVIAVTPAVLEEVIFRGMLQGRLMALLGRSAGLWTTAFGFAICHGQSAALPMHVAIGLYLGVLRERSGSLLPCMLMHFAYNGTLVVLGVA